MSSESGTSSKINLDNFDDDSAFDEEDTFAPEPETIEPTTPQLSDQEDLAEIEGEDLL